MTTIIPIFTIDKLTHADGIITTDLSINAESEIFNGHFPGQPVVPGACMLQLVKDVLESALDCTLRLKQAGHLKFISMIDPAVVQTVQLYICYSRSENIPATAELRYHQDVCFKFQGTFMGNG